MSKYILKRVLSIIPTVLIIIFAIFFILDFTPGTPGRVILGVTATEEQVNNLDEALGYNRPVVVRYVDYVVHAVQGDFGTSYVSQQPVVDILAPKFPTTLKLALLAVAISALLGIPMGIISALKPNSFLDSTLTTVALFFASVPSFWLGLMFMLAFSLVLGWLPSSGIGTWKHYIMPVITLVLPSAAYLSRLTRSTMIDAINQDYIRTAKSKGATTSRVMFLHALKNAMMPVVTQLGMSFASLLGGALITEMVFGLPGFGSAIVNAIKTKDIPIVMGGIIFLSTIFILIMLAVDLIYAFIDPRVKDMYE
ncbi:ABC transporter permease [Bariatricus massiliensis]|uniref:ABC transporter permease n=1 Tax=Bariatricus massiliensis TaxID=1745713 RepID=A0ABS8DKL0_9FIRM|nr:ABC transporter permease [Bariatricus massiliensis]MCB7305840.1 ABC transporter permease [Bariatricus massiliensis]MCB7376407.1 ABC transporter permease [Bariatricus massiliensis]MCB7388983.1 ABC transporter permease [Bariatricus massiliensis]MCB7413156.1 ABC transporter permease [Bariatricus massiliensis]MCQ5255051.1 ABC transporter permease [Bariatricus massiliensis]